MSHPEQVEFCERTKIKYPDFFRGKKVLDVGSADINGNNCYLFENCEYFGCDVIEGRNVNIVGFCHELNFFTATFDVIISTECLEHDLFYTASLRRCFQMLKVGGLFLMTCATTNRDEHGTLRRRPVSSLTTKLNINYYRNLTEADINQVLNTPVTFEDGEFSTNKTHNDLQFRGKKKTQEILWSNSK